MPFVPIRIEIKETGEGVTMTQMYKIPKDRRDHFSLMALATQIWSELDDNFPNRYELEWNKDGFQITTKDKSSNL